MIDAGRVFTHDRAHHRLDPAECRRLLGTGHLGRVALSVAALPAVIPVLYRVVGDRIVFAVEPDDLYAVLCDNIVAFEVDHVDDETNRGWTVQVVGRARPASDLTMPVFALPGPTGSLPPDRLIGVSIDRLSGLRTVEPMADRS
jgi:nitroimidazol reductase NimA-like FMN-containing flavoprotein (pyridoxamine 5'-phosphate oxidase superfamily)